MASTSRRDPRLSQSDPGFSGSLRHDQILFSSPPDCRVRLISQPTQFSDAVDIPLLPQENRTSQDKYTCSRTSSPYTSKADASCARQRSYGHHTYTTLSTPRYLSQPGSRKALYDRLLKLHTRGVNLLKLIDYHDRYAQFRSTRSFNLLISLALRHVSFGTVQWLFRSMESANIPRNLESRKLIVRWYVATGWWDRAWGELNQIGTENVEAVADSRSQSGVSAGRLSEVLWLEFFKGLYRGVGFKRLIHPSESSDNPVLLYARRFTLLMESRPVLRESTRPKVLHFVIHALLQMKLREDALSLARTYLDQISRDPPFLRSLTQPPLNLVHLFVAFGSSQRGLRRFHEARQLLMSFLFSYSFLVPTPTTLFLLLGNLKRAKKSGTIGFECFLFFKRKWGTRVDDNRVRRRLGSLAVKEGRMDIAGNILNHVPPPSPLTANIRVSQRHTKQIPRKGVGRQKSLWIRLLARRNRRASAEGRNQDSLVSSPFLNVID